MELENDSRIRQTNTATSSLCVKDRTIKIDVDGEIDVLMVQREILQL